MGIDRAIAQFLSGYFSTNERSRKTVTAYALDLRQFRAFLPRRATIGSIEPERIEQWAAKLKSDGYAVASIRRKLASVRCLFSYWVRRRTIRFSPMSGLRVELAANRTLPNFLTLDEVAAILAEAARACRGSDDFAGVRNLAIVEVMFATGMRVGELVSLRAADLSPLDRSVLIRGKGRRERLAFVVEPSSFRRIEHYLALRRAASPRSDALFVNAFGDPISTQTVALLIRTLCRRAGIARRITPHTFRHTVATLLLRNGADIRVVQELLGHASITMTQRYTHVVKEQMVDVLRRCHPSSAIAR